MFYCFFRDFVIVAGLHLLGALDESSSMLKPPDEIRYTYIYMCTNIFIYMYHICISKGPAAQNRHRAFLSRHCGALHKTFLEASGELQNSGGNSCMIFGTAM